MDNVENEKIKDTELKKIKEELLKKLEEYRKSMKYMAADAPIGILCLPKVVEKSLINHGCLRVYDLFDLNFAEVKGLSETSIRNLAASLDQFLSMC